MDLVWIEVDARLHWWHRAIEKSPLGVHPYLRLKA